MIFLRSSSVPFRRRAPKCFSCSPLLLGVFMLPVVCPASAQQAPPNAAPRPASRAAATPGANIFAVNADTLPTLPAVLASNRADAVSLDVSLAELQAAGAANAALMQWVRDGGVVFLHSDAARFFGYRTVLARPSTARVAGQLFGRAKAALPFGGHPLLWGAAMPANAAQGNAAARASGAVPRSTLSVRRIFYRMQPGDHLVVEHPAGVPLLRVSDLAAPAGNPLFAVALAPFGRGWAVFTPDLIEANRGDGAAFVRNLMRLVSSSSALRRASARRDAEDVAAADEAAPLPSLLRQAESALCSVPATAVDQLSNSLRDGIKAEFLPALSLLCARALSGEPLAADGDAAAMEGFAPRFMMARSEAAGLGALADIGIANEAARPAAMAMMLLWRARLELQRDNRVRAREWMEVASRNAPQGAEVLLWSGMIAAGAAEDITLSSRLRGQAYAQAAVLWEQAMVARPLLPRAQKAATSQAQSTLTALSGVPLELVRAWTVSARSAANMMSVEPPLVTLAGNPGNAIIVRHFPNDPALLFAVPTATTLANNASLFGWRADEEEILMFPTANYFQAYRQSAGLDERVRSNPLQRFGDIIGSRILIVSQSSQPVTLPSLTLGGAPRVSPFGVSVPDVLGRLHAQVLVNALTEDGGMAPEWMRFGVVALSNQTTNIELPPATTTEFLRRLAIANALRTARQFDNVAGGGEAEGIAEVQAQRMMAFFYARFGAGRVVETLQRLGSGESIDDALLATIDLNEEQFFQAWRKAELGPRF